MIYTTEYVSEVGVLTLASDGERLVGLWIKGQKYHGGGLLASAEERADLPLFSVVKDWLSRYFAGGKPEVSELPLAPMGSGFRQAVWAILCSIPYGETCTYGDIARALTSSKGTPMSAQAVGGAVGHNPISIIIPCHRVMGTGGSLTGYAGGIDKKMRLLAHEGVDLPRVIVPVKGTAL